MVKKNYAMGLWDMQTMIQCSLIIFFLGGLATLSYYKYNNHEATTTITNTKTNTQVFNPQKRLKITAPKRMCDLFSGRWAHDNKSHYPLYKEDECPYLEGTFACQTYGRKDLKYLQWRWQPHGCDFPRFDGNAVVKKLTGKRLLFVGDSLNRNQWNSMICMLHSSIPGVKTSGVDLDGNLLTFRSNDYNISIDFYWAPMLVESNGDSATDHHRKDGVFRLTAIQKHARHWVDADIIVFNSYHWWKLPVVKLGQSAGSLDGGDHVYEEIDNLLAYKMGLKTWSKWARTHVNLSKTKMFFMGVSGTHSSGNDWGRNYDENCYEETEPVTSNGFRESGTDPKMLRILDSTLSKLKAKGVNVQLINITQLTQYRKDAHTALYRKIWHPLTELEKKNPKVAADCSHWCLPGVPDIWNELLLAYILR